MVTSTSGTLTIVDVDTGEAAVQAIAGQAGDNGYGSFTVNTDGSWTYVAGAAVEALGAGQTVTDTITVTSADGGTTEVITITITGANDTATITGDTTGALVEDTTTTASGTLTSTDVDCLLYTSDAADD